MKSTLPKIERISIHPEVADELAKRAKALNTRADKSEQAWAELTADQIEMQARGSDGLLDAVASGESVELVRREHDLLHERIELHKAYQQFAPDYAAGLRDVTNNSAAEIEAVRQSVRDRLEEIGYRTYREPGVNVAETWEPRMIERHPEVRKAVAEWQSIAGRFKQHVFVQHHATALRALDAELVKLKVRLTKMAGVPERSQTAEPERVQMSQPVEQQTVMGPVPVADVAK